MDTPETEEKETKDEPEPPPPPVKRKKGRPPKNAVRPESAAPPPPKKPLRTSRRGLKLSKEEEERRKDELKRRTLDALKKKEAKKMEELRQKKQIEEPKKKGRPGRPRKIHLEDTPPTPSLRKLKKRVAEESIPADDDNAVSMDVMENFKKAKREPVTVEPPAPETPAPVTPVKTPVAKVKATEENSNDAMEESESGPSTPIQTPKDSRSQTPSRNDEESQGSNSAMGGMGPNHNKKGRMEIALLQEACPKVKEAEDVFEYQWPTDKTGDYYMLQEQVSEFLDIRSFRRRYPDVLRRAVEPEEKNYLREQGIVSEMQCDLGLTALRSNEVLDIMFTDFPEKYLEVKEAMRVRKEKMMERKVLEATLPGAAPPITDKRQMREYGAQLAKAASDWNANLNKNRREKRSYVFDLQSFSIHGPQSKIRKLDKSQTKVGLYPVALLPGQFCDYYREFTPLELRYLPLNSLIYGHPPSPPSTPPPQPESPPGSEYPMSSDDGSSQSSGSDDDSDDSSSSDGSSSSECDSDGDDSPDEVFDRPKSMSKREAPSPPRDIAIKGASIPVASKFTAIRQHPGKVMPNSKEAGSKSPDPRPKSPDTAKRPEESSKKSGGETTKVNTTPSSSDLKTKDEKSLSSDSVKRCLEPSLKTPESKRTPDRSVKSVESKKATEPAAKSQESKKVDPTPKSADSKKNESSAKSLDSKATTRKVTDSPKSDSSRRSAESRKNQDSAKSSEISKKNLDTSSRHSDSNSSRDLRSVSKTPEPDSKATETSNRKSSGRGRRRKGDTDGVRRGERRTPTPVCKECDRSDGSPTNPKEPLIICADCRLSGHPSCVAVSLEIVDRVRGYPWQCMDCKTCWKCKQPDDEDKMIFCDNCDRGYHIFCIGLRRVPQGRWHCTECAECGSCGCKDPSGKDDGDRLSTWQHEFTKGPDKKYLISLCQLCYKNWRKGRYCNFCLRCFDLSKEGQMIKCNGCEKYLHPGCDNVKQDVEDFIQKKRPYCCSKCK